jgi:hypothetical protein
MRPRMKVEYGRASSSGDGPRALMIRMAARSTVTSPTRKSMR